jgi:hypothetical protein
MSPQERPSQIAKILETVVLEYPADVVATLEAYLADLEARQPDQLEPITAILKTIAADLPLDAGASLTAYIAFLEARQLPVQAVPESRYWHGERRAADRRARALRKLTYTH